MKRLFAFILCAGMIMCAASARAEKSKILIVPIGDVQLRISEFIQEALEETFKRDVGIGHKIRLPSSAWDFNTNQYAADMILLNLEGYDTGRMMFREDYKRMLAVVNVPLILPGSKPGFGLANPGLGRAVITVEPLGESEDGKKVSRREFLRRVAKLAIYEIGLTYGLGQCKTKTCVMHPVKNLEELDSLKTKFCSKCRKKAAKIQ